jgi:hypothetical protein
VKFYETGSTIYLLLQHAAGGRLWSYVSSYLNQSTDAPQVFCNADAMGGCEDETPEQEPHPVNDDDAGFCGHSTPSRTAAAASGSPTVCQKLSVSCNFGDDASRVSRLSLSEVDFPSPNPDRDSAAGGIDANVTTESFSTNPECGSTGFDNILKSTQTEMNCFSIGSFDSASASRQASCSSELDQQSAVDLHDNAECLAAAAGRATGVQRDSTSADAGVGDVHSVGVSSDCEMSIYDKYRSSSCSSPSASKAVAGRQAPPSPVDETRDEDGRDSPRAGFPSAMPSVFASQDGSIVGELPKQRSTVLHLDLQDHSSEKPRSRRKRLRTLSSTFGELDLAGDVGAVAVADADDDAVRRRSFARLPESCVRQWAAEMIVAISRLHAFGIICRSVLIQFLCLIQSLTFLLVSDR